MTYRLQIHGILLHRLSLNERHDLHSLLIALVVLFDLWLVAPRRAGEGVSGGEGGHVTESWHCVHALFNHGWRKEVTAMQGASRISKEKKRFKATVVRGPPFLLHLSLCYFSLCLVLFYFIFSFSVSPQFLLSYTFLFFLIFPPPVYFSDIFFLSHFSFFFYSRPPIRLCIPSSSLLPLFDLSKPILTKNRQGRGKTTAVIASG